MMRLFFAVLPLLLVANARAGREICTAELRIGHDGDRWTYETGIGPDGAVPHPLEPRNQGVTKILETALAGKNAGVMVCMTGSFHGEVFHAVSARLNALPSANKSVSEQTRCGWFDNPTPGNWSLTDKEGEWTIAVQGDYRAAGADDLPDFGRKWVVTNAGEHGYGCACATVKVAAKEKTILSIRKVKVLPISKCRGDKSLPKR